jgi:hypothetical protein
LQWATNEWTLTLSGGFIRSFGADSGSKQSENEGRQVLARKHVLQETNLRMTVTETEIIGYFFFSVSTEK